MSLPAIFIKAQTTQTKKREDFQGFMDQVMEDLPKDKDVYVILDNYCTHKKNDDGLKNMRVGYNSTLRRLRPVGYIKLK